jgi:tetratricopeptide (TPR) repeat protein
LLIVSANIVPVFDSVPPRVWLLIALGAVAYAPALYVFQHIVSSPLRRDITQPPEDLSWRSSGQLVRSIAILAAAVGLALFIFTPAAVQLVRSPSFWPILMAACGAWALYTVPKGYSAGAIQPFVRGISSTFERKTQPKRFWASITWNAVFGCLCLWLGYVMIDQGVEDQCYDPQVKHAPKEELEACNRLIAKRGTSGSDYARLVSARGFAYHRLNQYDRALPDYNEALKLDPSDSYALYNRALIFERKGKDDSALADYSASLKLRPHNDDGLVNRGALLLRLGRLREAREDFGRALAIRPDNRDAMAYRGISFALEGDRVRANQDFAAVRSADPANTLLRQGQALLAAGNEKR